MATSIATRLQIAAGYLLARFLFYPTLLRNILLESPKRRWFDRIDSTVVLGALPVRSQTDLVSSMPCSHWRKFLLENVRHSDAIAFLRIGIATSCMMQLVVEERVRTVVSMNEQYELKLFCNSKEVS